MKKNIILYLLIFLNFYVFCQNETPKIFQLEWGALYNQVQQIILKSNAELEKLKYYPVLPGRDLYTDLMSSASLKFISKGSPFFNIPAEVIFTFYNPTKNINDLMLSKVEVYLSKKDNNDIWVDSKDIYKKLIKIFIKNYNIILNYNMEKQIYVNYDFQITINGVYVNIISNIDNRIIKKNESVFLNYESNKHQSMILKKEIELLEEANKRNASEDEKIEYKTRSNL